MAIRLTFGSVVSLGENIFPASSPVLKTLRTTGTFHANLAGVAHNSRNDSASKILAELNKTVSAGEMTIADDSQEAIAKASEGAFDRFALNYFVNTYLCLVRAIKQKILDSFEYQENVGSEEHSSSTELVTKAIDELSSIELQFSLGADPIPYAHKFHSSALRSFCSLLERLNIIWCGESRTRKEVLELASGEFYSWINSELESANYVRAYLNYSQQSTQQDKILEEVKGVTCALEAWISPNTELALRRQKAWDNYRAVLYGLPDEKHTMFDETFGVRKVFVQPKAVYRVAGSRGKSYTEVHDVAAMLGTLLSNRTTGEDLILLCGGPGSGKSTLCRFLASELSKIEQIHPIFLRLRRMNDTREFIAFLEENLQRAGLVEKITELADIPNTVLILDGFDELVMASRARLREFFNALKDELSTAPLRNAKVVVSGRDTLFPNGAGLQTGAHVISLMPFDRERIKKWGDKWRELHRSGKGKSFKPEAFVLKETAVDGQKTGPLEHLVSWPLTLHLVARAHTSGSIEMDAAASDQIAKAVLYRSIVADTALRQYEQSYGLGRLDETTMRKFVRGIAWEMYRQGKEALDLSEGLPILKDIFPDADESTLAELSDVTIVNQPELTKGEETGFEFVHKSFSEYFVAEKIAESLEKVTFKAQEWGVEDHTWRMSVNDATTELAEHFSVRLFTAEVQEMLEPMLGDFSMFLKNMSLENSASMRKLVPEKLDQKLHRLEGLLNEFSKGNLLHVVKSRIPYSGVHASDLEAFANYAAGLFLVGGSLCESLHKYKDKKDRKFEISGASFIRLVHIIQAGEVIIDRTFSNRAFYSIDVGSVEITENYFPPTQPAFLRGVKGLPDQLSEAVESIQIEYLALRIHAILERMTPYVSNTKERTSKRHERSYLVSGYEYQRRDFVEYLDRVLVSSLFGEEADLRSIEDEIYMALEGRDYFAHGSRKGRNYQNGHQEVYKNLKYLVDRGIVKMSVARIIDEKYCRKSDMI